MSRVNWPVFAMGVLWWWLETRYFGWNAHPESIAELFADGMALAIYALAFAFPPRKPAVHIHIGGTP